MTMQDANRKIVEAIDGVIGRFAIIALLSIIATIAGWTLKTVVDIVGEHKVLEEKLVGMQERTSDRLNQTGIEINTLNQSMVNLNDTIQKMELHIINSRGKN